VPAISFSDASNILKPAPAWRFYCTLPTISGSSVLNGQTLSFLIENLQAPNVGVSFEAAPYNAGERQFAVMRTIDALQISFAETTNFDVMKYLRAWKNLIIDDVGNFGLPASYKQNIQLQPLDETGEAILTYSWQGCAPSHIDVITFDGSTSHHVLVNATFTVDSLDPWQ
jgi:hypothetical protein